MSDSLNNKELVAVGHMGLCAIHCRGISNCKLQIISP